ncbi:MAG: DNA polymerase III subunit beta [Phycisphaerae bacterium]|jgi:DNA polymerase-3 subunit beta
MQFTADKKTLYYFASIAGRSSAARSSMPVLSNVLIETLPDGIVAISGTNLERHVRGKFSAKVSEDGAVTVNAKSFLELVSLLDGDVEIATKDNALVVKSGKAKTKLTTVPAIEFPPAPTIPDDALEVDAKDFLHALTSVYFSASTDEARPVMNGVRVKSNTLAASDGFRIAYNASGAELGDAVIPVDSIKEVVALFKDSKSLHVSINKNNSVFYDDQVTLLTQVIDGNFPDVDQIIPKSTAIHAELASADMLRAIKQANIISRESNNAVTFAVSESAIVVTAHSEEVGAAEISVPCQSDGEITIAFNCNFLREGIEKCASESITFGMNGPNQPVIMTGKSDDWKYVIMPMALG